MIDLRARLTLLSPFTIKAADKEVVGNHPMTGNVWGKWVVSEGSSDCHVIEL